VGEQLLRLVDDDDARPEVLLGVLLLQLAGDAASVWGAAAFAADFLSFLAAGKESRSGLFTSLTATGEFGE